MHKKESERIEMKKDIGWLKEKIKQQDIVMEKGYIRTDFLMSLIDKLDEPKVTLNRAFEKVAESYPMTKDEVWRHLELLEAYDGKVIYGKPEILSKEWIDKNKEPFHHFETKKVDYYVSTDFLQNLLVPQKEPEVIPKVLSQLSIDNDGTHVRNLGETFEVETIENLFVPKQELPVIPKFMSDWIEENRQRYKNTFFSIGYDLYDNAIHPPVDEWIIGNQEKFVRAWFDAYKIEEEQKLTERDVIEKHIELLKKQEEAVNLKPYYDLLERVKNE